MSALFAQWHANFNEAIATIEGFRVHDHADMRHLTRWLMETSANPYGYLPSEWARSLTNAQDFAGLLHAIHHALVDDGEITFVAVSGRPMIVFANREEIGNVELRGEVEREADERRGTQPTYQFIDGVNSFIDRQDRYEAHRAARIELAELRNSKSISMDEWRARALALDAAYEQSIQA